MRPGFIRFKATGHKVRKIFSKEVGGHRWQRIPPTEKRGRRQTSTITIACLDEDGPIKIELNDQEMDIKTTKGSGPGGQKRNKVETAVQIKHKPSGEFVSICLSTSQKKNKDEAKKILQNRLEAKASKSRKRKRDKLRKQQVGTGMRGDKVRTIQVHHNKVVNHANGKSITFKDYQRGMIEKLH